MPIPNIQQILQSGVLIGGTREEAGIGLAWLNEHQNEYDRVEFNVGLGPGIDLGPGVPSYVQKSATASTKPRADIIAYRGNTATIVEIKDRISGSALGQLQTYRALLTADRPQLVQVHMIAIGHTIMAGLPAIFDHAGVSVELFPLATPPTTLVTPT